MTRLEFMTKVGAVMTNQQWAWVGVDNNKKRVYFSTWEHLKKPGGDSRNPQYLVFAEQWGGSELDKKPLGFKDAKNAMRLIRDQGYEARLLMLVATEKFSYPDAIEGEEVKIQIVKGTQFFTASLNTENLGDASEMVFATITGKGYTRRPDDIELVSRK